MSQDVLQLQKNLINLIELDKEFNTQHSGKAFEPSICIMLDNELKWSAEIYIYSVELQPQGGRRYNYEADTFEELIKKIYVDVNKVYKNYKKLIKNE